MVQIIGTTVRSEKYGPVWKIRSGLELENRDCKKDRTVRSGTLGPQSGPRLDCSCVYMLNFLQDSELKSVTPKRYS
jgi:hypothetical protein